jgi:hypothetical protein
MQRIGRTANSLKPVLNKAFRVRAQPYSFQKQAEFPAVTGDVNVDGLTRYEIDIWETSIWVKELIQMVQNDTLPTATKWTPPSLPLVVQKTCTKSFDFAQKPVDDSHTYIIDMSKLEVTPTQRHFMLLLCKDKYDLTHNVIRLHSAKELKSVWEEVKKCGDYSGVKLDFSDVVVKSQKKEHPFPAAWLPAKGSSAKNAKI